MSPPPPWDWLPDDVVELIGWRVLAGDLLDYVRFRAVCTQWNRTTVRPAGRGLLDPRFHPRRWIMLPEGHGLHPGHPALGGHARFLNLSTGALVRLPLFRDHAVLDSTDGLLLLMRRHDTAVRLLHPFTGDVAELPPLSSLLPQMPRYDIMTEESKLRELSALSTSGVRAAVETADGAITVMLALRTGLLAHATTGHRRWTLSPHKLVGKTKSFHGKLYSWWPARDDSVYVWQADPPPPNAAEGSPVPSPKLIAWCPVGAVLPTLGAINLVDCGSELMIVGFNPAKPTDLVVYRLADVIRGRFVPVTSIGEHTLFLGERTLYATQNKGLPSVVANSIICNYRVLKTMSSGYQRLNEQYHIGTGTWSPAIDGDNSCSGTPPASPYMLIHHILTCCYHFYWSEGHIFPDHSILNGR